MFSVETITGAALIALAFLIGRVWTLEGVKIDIGNGTYKFLKQPVVGLILESGDVIKTCEGDLPDLEIFTNAKVRTIPRLVQPELGDNTAEV